jgi:CheY-like chemotaxis protein
MAPSILLVDDQRSIVQLLHSALDTLGQALEIIEAPSGEEALLSAGRRHVDLIVADYRLPGMNGIELIHKIRARQPEIKVILISGLTDRKSRDEMLNAGAVAVFDKPIPLGDFLGAVERSLGLPGSLFSSEADARAAARQSRLSELLANFRQDLDAHAVFLLSDRGRVLARAGDLYDSSMEVSLISALMTTYAAGLKISKFVHQEKLENYHIYRGGDQDLIFIPVNASYSLLLAGRGLADRERVVDTVLAMLALKDHVEIALQNLGVTGPLSSPDETSPTPAVREKREQAAQPVSMPELEELLDGAGTKTGEANDFWEQAAEKQGKVQKEPDVISYEEARRLGLVPGEDKK